MSFNELEEMHLQSVDPVGSYLETLSNKEKNPLFEEITAVSVFTFGKMQCNRSSSHHFTSSLDQHPCSVHSKPSFPAKKVSLVTDASLWKLLEFILQLVKPAELH